MIHSQNATGLHLAMGREPGEFGQKKDNGGQGGWPTDRGRERGQRAGQGPAGQRGAQGQ